MALTEERWTDRTYVNGSLVVHYNTKVVGTVAAAQAPRGHFCREGIGTRIVKFFGGHRDEPQTGDSLFDDMILVQADTPELVRQMLAHDGIQAVIMDAVGDFGNIRFEEAPNGDAMVTVRSLMTNDPDSTLKTGEQAVVAVALRHVQAVFGPR